MPELPMFIQKKNASKTLQGLVCPFHYNENQTLFNPWQICSILWCYVKLCSFQWFDAPRHWNMRPPLFLNFTTVIFDWSMIAQILMMSSLSFTFYQSYSCHKKLIFSLSQSTGPNPMSFKVILKPFWKKSKTRKSRATCILNIYIGFCPNCNQTYYR